ncbi:MAG: peroxiredoxin family protein [Pirellulaceae bacterium]
MIARIAVMLVLGLFVTNSSFLTGIEARAEEKPAAIKEGGPAPDFSLEQDQSSKRVQLSNFAGKKLVLVLSRANWCPFCMAHLKDLQAHYDRFQGENAEVLVIFREEATGIEGLNKIREMTDAKMPLALDLGGEKTAQYGQEGFPTYLIDEQGVVTKILSGTKAERPTAESILAELRK